MCVLPDPYWQPQKASGHPLERSMVISSFQSSFRETVQVEHIPTSEYHALQRKQFHASYFSILILMLSSIEWNTF